MEFQKLFLFCLILSSFTKIIALTKEQELDRISTLPGQPPVTFSQFSGYVTVNEKHGRALFYWFTEATSKPENKPLLLWLNGGPGCSSVAYGASEEIGPFRINKTGSSLYLNKYSWNKVANIIFLESPAGVGFSYTNTSSNLKDSGDKRTAQDALVFLLKWMSRFPQYKHRDFYISGESYAGHYVPHLAKQIYDHNRRSSHPIINLKGFIVGNAVSDNYYDSIGTVAYWWSHSMISDKTYNSIIKLCDFKSENSSRNAISAVNYAMNHEFGNIDQYSIYTPSCKATEDRTKHSMRLKNTLLRPRFSGYDPCTENYAEKYYNRPDVQKAMHANTTGIPYKWTACSDVLLRNWKDSEVSMLPTYKKLIVGAQNMGFQRGHRFGSTSYSNSIFVEPSKSQSKNSMVGGWTEVYNGLTFATIRGAGHEVPLFQPRRAFILLKTFLAGKDLPKS